MSPLSMTLLGGATVIAIGVWLLARWNARRRAQTVNCPRRLLKELCAKHKLSFRERRLIVGLVEQHQLEHPAVVFVDPRLWELDPTTPLHQRRRAELRHLRDRLFQSGEPAGSCR